MSIGNYDSDFHRGRLFQNRADVRVFLEEETLLALTKRIEESDLHISKSGLCNVLFQWILNYDIDLRTIIMNCDEFLEKAGAVGIPMTRPKIDELLLSGELLGGKFNKRYYLLRQHAQQWLVDHATTPYKEEIKPLEYHLAA